MSTEAIRGVSLHDPETDELREDTTHLVWDRGRWRWLRLRAARGRFVDPVEPPMWDTDVVLMTDGEPVI